MVDAQHDAGPEDAIDVAAFGSTPLAAALRRVMSASSGIRQTLSRRMSLSANEMWALEHLMAEPLGPVELARRMGLTSAAGTLLVRRLEDSGHLVREAHPTDQRRVVLRPTHRSARSVLQTLRPMLVDLDGAGRDLDDDQVRVLAAYLERVADAIEHFQREP